ncbi:MAG: GNAT family N-acetyltransferase [Oscillospiraceae bacterium]
MIIKDKPVTLTTDFTQADIEHSIKKHIEIFDKEYGFLQPFNDGVTQLIGDFGKTYNPQKDFMLISRVDGESAGTITAIGKENGRVQLRFFFVEPLARGLGIGKLLFTTAMEKSKEMGYTHAFFSTYNVLKVARTMYRQLGFVITETEPDEEVAPGVIEEIWEKDL